MQRADLITGIMTAGLSLWLLFYAIPVHTGEGMGYGLSPAGLPKIMAMSLFCLALIQIGNSLIQSIKRRSAGGEEKETGIGFSHGLFWIKLILLFAISLIGMNYIGFYRWCDVLHGCFSISFRPTQLSGFIPFSHWHTGHFKAGILVRHGNFVASGCLILIQDRRIHHD